MGKIKWKSERDRQRGQLIPPLQQSLILPAKFERGTPVCPVRPGDLQNDGGDNGKK